MDVKIALIPWDRADELRDRAAVHQHPEPPVSRRGQGLPVVALYGTAGKMARTTSWLQEEGFAGVRLTRRGEGVTLVIASWGSGPFPEFTFAQGAGGQGLTPRQWAESGRSVGTSSGERIEDVTYADRPAARKSAPGAVPTYFVAYAGRMYVVTPGHFGPPDAAMQQTMVRIVESFRFLTAAEQTAARAALPTAAPPRTPEAVADGVAAAFAAKNADALAGFLSPCVTTAGESAGASFVSREKYVADLRAVFAAGLAVTVRPRPFEGDPRHREPHHRLHVARPAQDHRPQAHAPPRGERSLGVARDTRALPVSDRSSR